MPLMVAINDYNDDVTVHMIEVNEEPDLWQEFRDQHGISSGAVPRTQVGDLSFIGYSATDGDLEYVAPHDGYIGYRNQIVDAIAEQAGHPLQLTADATTPAVTAEAPWRFPWPVLGLPILYVGSYPLLKGRLQNNVEARRFWFGGGLATISIVALFLLVTLTPDAVIKSFAQALPFPLFVSVVALADGFNPCAFTVLIILLSLLTHTRRRRDMAIVGGTFVATSAVMYFLFIMVMIGLGSGTAGAVWHSVFVDFGKRNCDRGPDQPERLLLVQEGSFLIPFPAGAAHHYPAGGAHRAETGGSGQ